MIHRSQKQRQSFTQAQNSRRAGPTNEEISARLESELAATKLHLQAETYGRIAACNELEIANSRICELRSQLQQTQAQLNTFNTGDPLPGPLKKLINYLLCQPP